MYQMVSAAGRISIIQGDITKIADDAIVNAANNTLLGGGGVDGAIHASAGPDLLDACRLLGGCETGKAKITPGFNLPARFVIHTVGPIWYGGEQGEPELLASCYRESLKLAVEYNLKTIAFPSISTGAFGYPLNDASRIAIREIVEFLRADSYLMRATLVCFSYRDYEIYCQSYAEIYG